MRYVLPVEPCPKPRMTRADKWKRRPAVLRYREFCDQLRDHAREQRFLLPDAGASFRFYISMPRSWSEKKKRRMDGQPHQQKPDVDNCVKAVFDALLGDDSTVWHLGGLEKRWARTGRIEIEVDDDGERTRVSADAGAHNLQAADRPGGD